MCLRHLKCQLSELDKLEFWRAEMLMENHKEAIEEENKKNKTQNESNKMPDMKSTMDSMMKGGGPMGMKMPKF